MRRTADKLDLAAPQGPVRLVHGEDQFKRDIEALPGEEAKLDCRGSGEVRIGNEVRDGELHRYSWVAPAECTPPFAAQPTIPKKYEPCERRRNDRVVSGSRRWRKLPMCQPTNSKPEEPM